MINEAKQILTTFAQNIPQTVLGPERIRFIIDNIDHIPQEQKLLVLQLANHILSTMIDRNASDIELGGYGAQGFVWFRVFGKKERVKELPQFTEDESAVLILSLLNKNQFEFLLKNRNLDFSYSFHFEKIKRNVRFRADCYFDLDTLALNMRAIQATVRSLESLEFHPYAIRMMSHNYIKFGLSLITGITGSGKSTTLDAVIDFHNKFDPCHVVIIASPVEYVHTSQSSIIKHREVGRDVIS